MAGEATKAGMATGNPYAAAAGFAVDALSGAGGTGASPSNATQDYGSLNNVDKRVNVGNTGLNLGAILLPFQENSANGGMGLQLTSRWLDKNYPVDGAAKNVPTAGGGLVDQAAPFILPVAVGVGALAVLIVLMRKRA